MVGVDVARFGADRTVIVVRRGATVVDMQVFHGFANTEVADEVQAVVHEQRPKQLNVDATGVGSGVVDILNQEGHPVYGFHGAGAPVDEADTCANLRAEGYWTLARRFRDHTIRIPPGRGADRRAGVVAVPLQQPGQGADGKQGEHQAARAAVAGPGRRPDAGLPGRGAAVGTSHMDAGPVHLSGGRFLYRGRFLVQAHGPLKTNGIRDRAGNCAGARRNGVVTIPVIAGVDGKW